MRRPTFLVCAALLLSSSSARAQTWISNMGVSPGSNSATVNWMTAVPADSQVEYGTSTAYGNSTSLTSSLVTSHSVAISGLQPGTTYHCRVRSHDANGVLVMGLDYAFSISAALTIAVAPASATVASGGTQQLTATVGNNSNTAVTWSAAVGTVSASGLFTAPVVTVATTVTVTARSVADSTKSAAALLTITPPVAVSVSPASASVASGGQQQFAATVNGSSNTSVSWSASGGSINASGLFTAPTVSAATTVMVTAASQADSTKLASAAVTISPSNSAGTYLLGDQTIESTVDTGSVGVAEAVQVSAAASGTLNALSVYVDASSTAANWMVGLYSDNGGHPGNLLTAGNSSAFQPAAWNTVAVQPLSVTAGNKYWIALLGGGGGTVAFRAKYSSGGGLDEIENVRTLAALPAAWQTGKTYSGVNLAAFGSGGLSTAPPPQPVLAVSPAALSFAAKAGATNLTPQSVSVTNTGAGTLTFTGASDQPWLALAPPSGSAPTTIAIAPSAAGMTGGTYTGHITVSGGGSSKVVTVSLSVTASTPVTHTVNLAWQASSSSNVISYNVYRSTVSGGSYGLIAGSVGARSYSDQSVQSGISYYYVVTALDDQGKESVYSNEIKAAVP